MPISDEQIKQVLFSKDAPVQNDQVAVSDKQVSEILFSSKQDPIDTSSIKAPESDVTPPLMDSLKLAFSDRKGQENYYRNKYKFVTKDNNGQIYAGDSPDSISPMNPDSALGFVVSSLAPTAGQIGGAIGGATVGSTLAGAGAIPGAVIGAGAGAALGTKANIEIGKKLGVRGGTEEEQNNELLLSGILGSAFEGGGALIGKASEKFIAPRVARMLDEAIDKQSANNSVAGQAVERQSTPAVKALSSLLKFTAGVDEKAVQTAAKYGFENTFTNKNLDPRSAIELVKRVEKAINAGHDYYGDMVKKARSKILNSQTQLEVDVKDLSARLVGRLQENGIIDESGKIISTEFKDVDKNVFEELLKDLQKPKVLFDANGSPMGSTTKTISLKDALKIKDKFDDAYNLPGLSNKGRSTLIEFLNDGGNESSIGGLRARVLQQATKIDQGDLLKANKAFYDFRSIVEQIPRVETERKATLERFLKGMDKATEYDKLFFQTLQNKVPQINFLADVEKFNAAQQFTKFNPQILRIAMIAGTVGATFATDDSVGSKAVKLGLASLLGTPAGARFMLSQGERLIKQPKNIISKMAAKKISERGSQVLRSILAQSTNSYQNKREQKQK